MNTLTIVALCTTWPTTYAQCLTEGLPVQDFCCCSCKLLIVLQFGSSFYLSRPHYYASSIAAAARSLKSQNVLVTLHLTSEDGEQDFTPCSNVLEILAPYLQRVDLRSALVFPETHLKALKNTESRLGELSVIDYVDRTAAGALSVPVVSVTAWIATCCQLTKLHLTSTSFYDLQPLASLTCLQDLAIQSPHLDLNCYGVLVSSRQSLQHITLAALGWHTLTYAALTCIGCLQSLVLKVDFFAPGHALAMSGLHPSVTVQVLFKAIEGYDDCVFIGMTILSRRILTCITSLVLVQVNSRVCQWVYLLSSLKDLCIIRGQDMTGVEFSRPLPALTSLQLISCLRY